MVIQQLGIGRRWSWSGDGGDWANGAGGYVGTWGDNGDCYRENGNNGVSEVRSDYDDSRITGVIEKTYRGYGDDAASYFTFGVSNNYQNSLRYESEYYQIASRWTRWIIISKV